MDTSFCEYITPGNINTLNDIIDKTISNRHCSVKWSTKSDELNSFKELKASAGFISDIEKGIILTLSGSGDKKYHKVYRIFIPYGTKIITSAIGISIFIDDKSNSDTIIISIDKIDRNNNNPNNLIYQDKTKFRAIMNIINDKFDEWVNDENAHTAISIYHSTYVNNFGYGLSNSKYKLNNVLGDGTTYEVLVDGKVSGNIKYEDDKAFYFIIEDSYMFIRDNSNHGIEIKRVVEPIDNKYIFIYGDKEMTADELATFLSSYKVKNCPICESCKTIYDVHEVAGVNICSKCFKGVIKDFSIRKRHKLIKR